MRFPSPSVSIAPTARGLAFIALALVMFAMGGACEDQHVGRPCELGTTPMGGSSGQIATVSSPALECPSHICLLPGAEKDPRSQAQINAMTSGTGPLCTASCESSEDCEDGETGQRRQRRRQALPQRVRLHLADDGRQLHVPAHVRLSRLLHRAGRRREEADRLRQLAGSSRRRRAPALC